jgi:hypothetical protein
MADPDRFSEDMWQGIPEEAVVYLCLRFFSWGLTSRG